MIIPTPEYDPMFANDGVAFRDKMTEYIQREFSDLLGARVTALQTDEGLEALSAIYGSAATSHTAQRKAA